MNRERAQKTSTSLPESSLTPYLLRFLFLDAQGDFLYSPSRKMQRLIISFITMEDIEQTVEVLEEVVADR